MRENDFSIVSFAILHVLTRDLDISISQMPLIREALTKANVGRAKHLLVPFANIGW